MGSTVEDIFHSLKQKKNFVRVMDEWNIEGLRTKLAAPIDNFVQPSHYSRKNTRSWGRVSLLAVTASENALIDAGLLNDAVLTSGRTGVAYGSSSGSIDAVCDFYSVINNNTVANVTSSTYIKMMGHTCPVNISVYFKLTGRLIPTGTACTSGSLAIGNAYEAIKYGHQDIMIAGGAEELSPTQAVVFDTLFATSIKNDSPKLTPSPYDIGRDGLVIGEGAGTLILEEYEHAKARGATIYAEVIGFGTNTDGAHITQPNKDTMGKALQLAIDCAGIAASDIGYVNGHGTATKQGDVAETQAVRHVFGKTVPISSQKSYLGHTLGACGALESIMSIQMMNTDWYAPTLNLISVDPDCAELEYITGDGKTMSSSYVMNNNFAFGGINTSLIFKRV
jgi:3-oxoacyl-[acyl-carrier-protein] synthase II